MDWRLHEINIFDLPQTPLSEELTTILAESDNARIERIISTGQTSDWYDQDETELVALLEGEAVIEFNDGRKVAMSKGDTIIIKPHERHRVSLHISRVAVCLAVHILLNKERLVLNMKPMIIHKKCFADIKICTAKTSCPVNAIGFVKVEEAMLDKTLTDKCNRCPLASSGISGILDTPDGIECKCGVIGTADNPVPIGDPFVRVVIDYDKCTCCGFCIEGCCGYAIEMVEDDVEVEDYNYSGLSETKSNCGCAGSCS